MEGGSASVRFDAAQPIALIVRAKDNKADPMSIVRVFRMKSTKKNRSAVISAVGSFSVNSNTMDYLRFSAEKYGESSYRLTFDERPAGEYGIIVSNPNNVDEKMVIVSAFAHRRRSRGERVSRNHTVPISAVQSDSAPFSLIAEQVKSP